MRRHLDWPEQAAGSMWFLSLPGLQQAKPVAT
jgi:hypothetical protein